MEFVRMSITWSTNKDGIIGKMCTGYQCSKHWCPLTDFSKSNGKRCYDGLRARCKDCRKIFYEVNKEPILGKMQSKSQSLEGKFIVYKRNSKANIREFKLTFDEFCLLCTQPCYYCDEIQLPFNGVDRMGSNKGYTLNNCVPCCSMCNKMKMEFSVDNFDNKCKKIVDKRCKK